MKSRVDFLLKTFIVVLISLISILIVVSRPTITLKGDKEIKLNYNEKYKEPGYVATFILKNLTKKVKVKNNIDNTKIGDYKVKYSLKVGNFKTTKERVVKIVDTKAPTIELTGNSMACPNAEYVEEGYTANDEYDGDITEHVSVEKSNDEYIYTVMDSSSNKATINRKITYIDTEKPNIVLNGQEVINITVGTPYQDLGVTVSDNCDSKISEKLETNNTVNVNKVGSYTITYKVTDESGNENEITRKVNVTDVPKTGLGKVIYLTFDDGPSSSITPSLLKILKEEGVKATFFVINHDDSLNYLIKQEYDEGHKVALHSYTHTYSYVYSSVENYFKDLNDIREKVHNITGEYVNIIRFPGGSSNTVSKKYSPGIMSYLSKEVQNRGYHYFDWNVSSGDAGDVSTSEGVYSNVTRGLGYMNNIVLMHDYEGNYKTLNAIRDIIRYGKEHGYVFKTIDETTQAVHHGINN